MTTLSARNTQTEQIVASHSPSRSISKTLMASCVLSGRTSLAGSVCLLWMPGETEDGGGCMSLMKGCAPAMDIMRLCTLPDPPKTNVSCGDKQESLYLFYRAASLAVIHLLICI